MVADEAWEVWIGESPDDRGELRPKARTESLFKIPPLVPPAAPDDAPDPAAAMKDPPSFGSEVLKDAIRAVESGEVDTTALDLLAGLAWGGD